MMGQVFESVTSEMLVRISYDLEFYCRFLNVFILSQEENSSQHAMFFFF
jgi:hypothetical protein